MSTTEIATQLVELCRQGKYLEAIDTLYAKDVVSVEAMAMPPMPQEMKGIAAVRGKTQWWIENHEVHNSAVVGPFVAGDRFIVNFDVDVTNKKSGKRAVMFESGLYTIANGKIVRDEFFYQVGEKGLTRMTPTIEQSLRFAASAQELYDLYMDPARHAEFTAAGAVKISPKPGSKFSAFDGMLEGTMLSVIPGKLIVQRWRSCMFKEADLDSVLTLYFVDEGKRGRIDLIHANVPEHDHAGVTEGWEKHYWKPLRAYLKRRK